MGYKKKYEMIITMDGNGTHDPIYINKIIKILKTKKFSLVITNRFLNKDSMKDWTLWRKALTTLRHKLLKFLLNIKLDSSGALRGYLTKQIDMDDIFLAKNQSYFFFLGKYVYSFKKIQDKRNFNQFTWSSFWLFQNGNERYFFCFCLFDKNIFL